MYILQKDYVHCRLFIHSPILVVSGFWLLAIKAAMNYQQMAPDQVSTLCNFWYQVQLQKWS